jgi:hypothetical protein
MHTLRNIQRKKRHVLMYQSLDRQLNSDSHIFLALSWQAPFSLNMLTHAVTILAYVSEVLSLKLNSNVSPFWHISRQNLQLRHDCLLPHYFKFVIHPVTRQYT